jgi:hypothetical protein
MQVEAVDVLQVILRSKILPVRYSKVSSIGREMNVWFTTESTDTEVSRGMALNHVIDSTNRQPGSCFEHLPFAYIGAYGSAILI